jgi:hypothetical protein
MAVLGREAASQAMTSEDIVDGAFTLNDLNFTDVPANLDITGTIDKNTMRLAEGVTVIGDVTISDDLVLAKLSDDGVGITMTTDGTTRTITGSGSIEATTIAQTHSPSLTGMTGTIDSEVTLGSTTTFPTGVSRKVYFDSDPQHSTGSVTANTWYDSNLSITTDTPASSNSKFIIQGQFHLMDGNNCGAIRILRGTTEVGTMLGVGTGDRPRVTAVTSWQGFDDNQRAPILSFCVYDAPNSEVALTYKLQFMVEGTVYYINRNANHADNSYVYSATGISTLIITEIS